MLTLGTMAVIPFAMGGGKGAKNTNTPPINAGSKDEEKFIQYASRPTPYTSELTNVKGILTTSRAGRQGEQDLWQGGPLDSMRMT